MQTVLALLVPLLALPQAVPAGEPPGCRDPRRFGEVAEAAKAEFEAAYAAAGRDAVRAGPALDAVVVRYDPCWNSLADNEARRLEAKVEAAPAGERAAMRDRARAWLNGLRTGHKAWREQIVRNGTLASPAPPPPPPRR